MNYVEHNFTPVRRREDTIHHSIIHSSSSMPWTAARCHRLLRPVRSRVELLRKDLARVVPADTQILQDGTETSIYDSDYKDTAHGSESNSPWLPYRKKARRTYGGRCRSQTTSKCHLQRSNSCSSVNIPPVALGQICVPTPILSRMKDETMCSENGRLSACAGTEKPEKTRRPQHRYATRDGEAHHRLSEQLRQIRRVTAPSKYALYDGLYNALETMLKATNPPVPRKPSFPRSLFSMCLRTVPRWIKEEEEWTNKNIEEQGTKSAIENLDISAQTYSDLESYGCAEAGWNHLRTVVRAHGVLFVSDAIHGGLIDARFASAMVMLCVHTRSLEEGDILLTSLLQSSQYPGPTSVHSQFSHDLALLPLSTLLEYSRYTGRTAYLHHQLAHLITKRMLPLTWLATDQMSFVWTSVFRSLSVNFADEGALYFLTNVLTIFADVRCKCGGNSKTETQSMNSLSSVLNTTLESALTTITAIALLRNGSARGRPCTNFQSSQERDNVTQMITGCMIDHGLFRMKLSDTFAGLLAISSLLGHSAKNYRCSNDSDFVNEIFGVIRRTSQPTIKPTQNSTETKLPIFLCSVARCCGRGASNCGFEYLKVIAQHIRDQSGSSIGTSLLRQLVIDTAYIFAQQLPTRAHLEYAESLSYMDALVPQPPLLPSRASKQQGASFRWEEGISEWVTATPVTAQERIIAIRPSLDDVESDYDTPVKPMIKRRKIMQTSSVLKGRAKTSSNSNPKRFLPDSTPYALQEYKNDRRKVEALLIGTPVDLVGEHHGSRNRNIQVVHKSPMGLDLPSEPLSDSDDVLLSSFQSKRPRRPKVFKELQYSQTCQPQPHPRMKAEASSTPKRQSWHDWRTSLHAESDDELGM